MSTWFQVTNDGVVLRVHVQPGAKRSEVVGLHGDALKLRLAAPPVGGKANECLLAFVARALGVPRARVELISGQTSRSKRVAISGVDGATAAQLYNEGEIQ